MTAEFHMFGFTMLREINISLSSLDGARYFIPIDEIMLNPDDSKWYSLQEEGVAMEGQVVEAGTIEFKFVSYDHNRRIPIFEYRRGLDLK